jgi:hypothetical protein
LLAATAGKGADIATTIAPSPAQGTGHAIQRSDWRTVTIAGRITEKLSGKTACRVCSVANTATFEGFGAIVTRELSVSGYVVGAH